MILTLTKEDFEKAKEIRDRQRIDRGAMQTHIDKENAYDLLPDLVARIEELESRMKRIMEYSLDKAVAVPAMVNLIEIAEEHGLHAIVDQGRKIQALLEALPDEEL